MRQQNPSVQLCDTKHATQQKHEGPVFYTVWLMVLTLWMICNRDFNTDGMPHRRHLGLHYKDRGQQYMKIWMVIFMTFHDEAYRVILCYRPCKELFTLKGNLVLCCTNLCDSCVNLAMLPFVYILWIFWRCQCLTLETKYLWPLSYLHVLRLGRSECTICTQILQCTKCSHTLFNTYCKVIRQDAP